MSTIAISLPDEVLEAIEEERKAIGEKPECVLPPRCGSLPPPAERSEIRRAVYTGILG